MKTNLTRMTLAFASIGMLAGCNDSLDVQVMDGYLTNAQVWLDVNGNRQFEQNEPQAYTDQKGIAKINVAGLRGDVKNYYLMASVIKGKTVDQDIPTVKAARNYLMMAPANYPVISPFTTYLSVQMQNGKRESKALAELKKALRIPTLDVKADYVDNHILVAQSAKALAQLLPATIDDSSLPELANTLKKASKLFGDEIKKSQREKSDIRDKTLMLKNGEPVIGFDSDRDGVADLIDHFPYDIQESIDSDNDGIGDHADLDDDNDGWPDETELRLGTDPY
ncbi:MAG: DUF3372 domain-containing protein, partial [Vibrio anguillarum]